MTPEQKQFLIERKKATDKLQGVYDQTYQACVAMTDKLSKTSRDAMPYLSREEKELLQKRFNWITSYLRHFKLGDDCLHLIKEMEVLVERDHFDQWTKVEDE